MVKLEKKKTGSFYTDNRIAKYLTRRVVDNCEKYILEPSFGDGAFLDEIISLSNEQKKPCNNVYGVEIRKDVIENPKSSKHFNPSNFLCSDFLLVDPFPVDIVIGNPPFISLKNVSEKELLSAKKVLEKYAYTMPKNGSMWLPFLLHACSFLKRGGKVSFVMPFEITYVRYIRELWGFLGKNFSELTVIRVFEDIFPDVDVETILFIANDFGGSTNKVNYEIYESRNDLLENKIIKKCGVSIKSIINGDRPFVYEVLNKEQIGLLKKIQKKELLVKLESIVKFNIGYVSADKEFFHPSQETIRTYGIEESHLLPAISDAKELKKGIGLYIEPGIIKSRLFNPQKFPLSINERKYITYGETKGVHKRYKCRIRNPWYVTPQVDSPDLILTVFGDKPSIYINSGKYFASNSLLCGYIKGENTREKIISSWYNSLTLLSIELKIHSLGGGVLVIIPGEANKIEILNTELLNTTSMSFIQKINDSLRANQIENAYLLGDQYIQELNLVSENEIKQIRASIEKLRLWRNAKKRKFLTLD